MPALFIQDTVKNESVRTLCLSHNNLGSIRLTHATENMFCLETPLPPGENPFAVK
jgi:hypothetical protein